jgi:pimeloyl-ACP methyl ester carboxylesterase
MYRLALLAARLLAITAAAAALAGCARLDKPDLERLYASTTGADDQPPVVVIPGLMGTRLEDARGREVWIGSLRRALWSRYDDLALKLDPKTLTPAPDGIRPTGITDSFAGRDFYASIIRTLEEAGGYHRAEPGAPPSAARSYYVFTYDWRQDNVETVRRLDQFIEQIRRDHGGDMPVDIIAHYMGGLITRYYLRYGPKDVTLDNRFPVNFHGEDRVRRVVLLGTPNLGSVESLKAFIAGRRLGLRRVPPEVLVTFPSFYQLFPHPINDWLLDAAGEPLDLDPFDLEVWQRFEWSIFDPEVRARIRERFDDPAVAEARLALLERWFHKYLERGRRFVWSLTVEMDRSPWQLVVFGGDCELTPARLVVHETDAGSGLYLHPETIGTGKPGVDYARLMLEPGDGTVTKASLLARNVLDPLVPRHPWSFFPLDYPLMLCAEHSALTGNLFFQDNLLHFLLHRD